MGFVTSKVINISDSVEARKVYFNQQGKDMVADLRAFFEDAFYEKSGEEVQLSLPVLIHTVMAEYIREMKLKGTDIEGLARRDEVTETGGQY